MKRTIQAANGRDALYQTAWHVLTTGEEVSPRGLRTREVRHLQLEIHNPYDVLCTGIGANQSPRVAAAEAVQLLGGFSNPRFAVEMTPNLARFRNQAGEFDGAYGPPVFAALPRAIAVLTHDRDSRQAIVPIWGAGDLHRDGSLDYPCTLSLGFFIRRDRLELDVTMRSNDVNWGLKNDLFQFTQLQLAVADSLALEAGPYRHTAFSMHLYESSWDWAEKLDGSHRLDPLPDHPAGEWGRPYSAFSEKQWRATRAALQPGALEDPTPTEMWYVEKLHG